jgi:hypothetical protein
MTAKRIDHAENTGERRVVKLSSSPAETLGTGAGGGLSWRFLSLPSCSGAQRRLSGRLWAAAGSSGQKKGHTSGARMSRVPSGPGPPTPDRGCAWLNLICAALFAMLLLMKDQYFADINDYRKYGLLRILGEGLRVGVCWMLTKPDGSGDDG